METTRFYSNNNPELEEIVSCIVKEINQQDNVIKLYLPDYNKNAFMSFKKATNRKKIRSWNKILPLNKEIICKVESINSRSDKIFIEVSKAYLDMDSQIVKKFQLEQKNNYRLKSIFKMLYNVYEDFNYKKSWEEIVYPLDILRKNEESELFLFDFILSNFDDFIKKFSLKQQKSINEFLNKNNKISKDKYKIKFGLYSKYYTDTTYIIKESLKNIDDVQVKIDKVPYFLVYGSKNNITNFCKKLIKISSQKDKSYLLENDIDKYKFENC